jgi:arylsulfatase A-like enzyme
VAAEDREELVSLVDVMPTVLSLTRTPLPERLDGVDLTRPIASDRGIFSDSFALTKRGDRFRYDRVVLVSREHKLVHDRVDGLLEINLRSDRAHPAQDWSGELDVPELRSELSRYLESSGGPPRIAKP